MSHRRSLLDHILETFFPKSSGPAKHDTKRKLGLESLEVREMLSVNPLGDDGAPTACYGTQTTGTDVENYWTINVESVKPVGNEPENDVIVDPKIPTGLIAVGNSAVSIKCQWDAVEGANSYRVQRSTDGINWVTATTTSSLSFEDWNRFTDDEFFYRVASIDSAGKVSEYGDPVAARRRITLESPVLSVRSQDETSVTLQWSKVENATRYTVWRSIDDGQSWLWHGETNTDVYVASTTGETDYLFRVACSGFEPGFTASDRSNIVNVPKYVAASSVPWRPSGLKAVSENSSGISISWNVAKYGGSYILETANSPSGPWSVLYEGTETEYLHENTEKGVFHYYRVRAVNADGVSDNSYSMSCKSLEVPEDAAVPVNLSSTTNAQGLGVTLRWKAVEGSASYLVQWSSDGVRWEAARSATTVQYYHAQSTPDAEHFYRVASVDLYGNISQWSDVVSGRSATRADVPELQVANYGNDSIRLEWAEAENALSYNVEVSTDGGASWRRIASYTSATSVLYDISSNPDGEYRFRLQVWETESGYLGYSGYSNMLIAEKPTDASIPVPGRPSGLSASAICATSINVSWNASSDVGFYRLERKTESGGWITVFEGSETNYSDVNLDETTWYSYRVHAVNASGESNRSHDVSAYTPQDSSSPIVFEITRSGESDRNEPLTVCYRLSGEGKLGVDYAIPYGYYDAKSDYGTIVIPAGLDSVKLSLEILENEFYKGNRDVRLTLLSGIPDGDDVPYIIGENASALATIEENNKPPIVSDIPIVWIESSHGGIEGSCDARFRLQRDIMDGRLAVQFQFGVNGTAAYAEDFTVFGAVRDGDYWTIIFEDGQEFADVILHVIDDGIAEGTEIVFVLLSDPFSDDYLLGPVVLASIAIHDPVENPEFSSKHKAFQIDVGGIYSVNDPEKGLCFDAEDGSRIILDSGPSHGELLLNEDGTFSYKADSNYVGADRFTYKIVHSDGSESESATVLIAVSPKPGGEAVLPGEPVFVAPNPVALNFIGGEESTPFIPDIIGTYTITDTIATTLPKTLENEDGTTVEGTIAESRTVTITMIENENGWVYTEIVTWNYVENYGEEDYTGGYVYVFSAWSSRESEGYVFNTKTSDTFEIGTIPDANNFSTNTINSLSTAAQSDVTLQITGTVMVSLSMTLQVDLESGDVLYEDRQETDSTTSIVMKSADSSFVAVETVYTLVTNTLKSTTFPDGIIETELTGTERARITYTGTGHAKSDDPALLGLESGDLNVSNFEMSTSFEYVGEEFYSMEFAIVSIEREIVAQNGAAEWEVLSLSGEYAAETSSSLYTKDAISTSYELVGANEHHSVLVSLEEEEESRSEADWISTLDSEGEWQLTEGASSLEGVIRTVSDSIVRSVVEIDEASTDAENGTRTVILLTTTATLLNREDATENYMMTETVSGGQWITTSGTMNSTMNYRDQTTLSSEGTAFVQASDHTSMWELKSYSYDNTDGSLFLESVWQEDEDWFTDGWRSETNDGFGFEQAMICESSYLREIDGMTVSGYYGYSEMSLFQYGFNADYSWVDDAWTLSHGNGESMATAEEGTSWSATGTFTERHQTGEDGDGVVFSTKLSGDSSSGDMTVRGTISEWGFTSNGGGGATIEYTVSGGEWVASAEGENIATSTEYFGYDMSGSGSGGGVSYSMSSGSTSFQQTVVGYDADWENELWGTATVRYSESSSFSVGKGSMASGALGGFGGTVMPFGLGSASSADYGYSYGAVYALVPVDEDVEGLSVSYGSNSGGTGTVGFCSPVVNVFLDENTELEWKQIAFSANVKTKQGSGVSRDEAGYRSSKVDNDWTTDGGYASAFGGSLSGTTTPVGGQNNGNNNTGPTLFSTNGGNNGGWQDPREYGKTEVRNDWNTTVSCVVEVGGVTMSGTEKNEGFRENKVAVSEEGNETRSTEGENTKTINTKSGENHYNSRDYAYDKTTEYHTLSTEGELVLTGGNGNANGDRSWDFKIKTFESTLGDDGLGTVTQSSLDRTTTGNYSDTWNSNSSFISGKGIVMTSGNMGGTATVDTTEIRTGKIKTDENVYQPGTWERTFDYTKETGSTATRKEVFELKQTVDSNHAWKDTKKKLTVTNKVENAFENITSHEVYGNTFETYVDFNHADNRSGTYDSTSVTDFLDPSNSSSTWESIHDTSYFGNSLFYGEVGYGSGGTHLEAGSEKETNGNSYYNTGYKYEQNGELKHQYEFTAHGTIEDGAVTYSNESHYYDYWGSNVHEEHISNTLPNSNLFNKTIELTTASSPVSLEIGEDGNVGLGGGVAGVTVPQPKIPNAPTKPTLPSSEGSDTIKDAAKSVWDAVKSPGEIAGNAIRAAGNWIAEGNQKIADNPPFDSEAIAAVYGASANLIGNITGMIAGTADWGNAIEGVIEDVSQSVAVGQEHGVAVGVARQVGILQMAEAYYGTGVGSGEPVDPTGSVAEGAGRLGGTAAIAAGGITAGKALKTKPKINKPLGRGNTGRTEPQNLREKLAMEEAISKPTEGKQIVVPDEMNDSRWLGSEGWEKRAQHINGVEVHYNYNPKTLQIDDIKFKDK